MGYQEIKTRIGLNVAGNIRVFAKTKEVGSGNKKFTVTDYWTNVSKKNEKGEYENKSLKLVFGKNDDKPKHNTVISVYQGYMMLYGNGDYQTIALFVKDWGDA